MASGEQERGEVTDITDETAATQTSQCTAGTSISNNTASSNESTLPMTADLQNLRELPWRSVLDHELVLDMV